MWEKLTQADIEQANQQLKRQRQEMLTRQAEEMQSLQAEENEITALEQLLAAFAGKFKNRAAAMTPPPADDKKEPAAVPVADPKETIAPAATIPERNPDERASTTKRNYAQSNFDTFTRALSKLNR